MVDYLNPFNPDDDENGKKNPAVGDYTPPAAAPLPTSTPAPAPAPAPAPVVGASGFDYSGKWDNIGPGRVWNMGDRPPSKEDWEAFTPEQRAAFGITNIEAAREAWQERYRQGGDLYQGGAAVGAGGGGGGGVTRSSSSAISGPDDGLSAQIRQMLSDLMSGKLSAYTPEVMANSLSKLKRDQAGAMEGATDRINRDAISRGIFRSGIPAESIAAAGRSSASDYAKGAADLENEKAQSDIAIRLQALDDADAYITRRESALLQSEQNDIARSLGLKQLDLERYRIGQQREMLMMQLQNSINLAELGLLNNGLF